METSNALLFSRTIGVTVIVLAVLLITAILVASLRTEVPFATARPAQSREVTAKQRCPQFPAVIGGIIDVPRHGSQWPLRKATHRPVLIETRKALFSPEAWEKCLSGIVVAELLVGADGRVKDGRLLQSLSPALDRNAAEAMTSWRFIPALRNDEPVASSYTAVMRFDPNSATQRPR